MLGSMGAMAPTLKTPVQFDEFCQRCGCRPRVTVKTGNTPPFLKLPVTLCSEHPPHE